MILPWQQVSITFFNIALSVFMESFVQDVCQYCLCPLQHLLIYPSCVFILIWFKPSIISPEKIQSCLHSLVSFKLAFYGLYLILMYKQTGRPPLVQQIVCLGIGKWWHPSPDNVWHIKCSTPCYCGAHILFVGSEEIQQSCILYNSYESIQIGKSQPCD